MSIKLDKLGADRDRALRKRNEWDAKFKELDRLYKERENTEIHDIVHAANLTPDQLADLLRMFAEDAAPKPAVINTITSEEETYHEN